MERVSAVPNRAPQRVLRGQGVPTGRDDARGRLRGDRERDRDGRGDAGSAAGRDAGHRRGDEGRAHGGRRGPYQIQERGDWQGPTRAQLRARLPARHDLLQSRHGAIPRLPGAIARGVVGAIVHQKHVCQVPSQAVLLDGRVVWSVHCGHSQNGK